MFLKVIEDPCISVCTLEIKTEKFLKYRIYVYKGSREVTPSHHRAFEDPAVLRDNVCIRQRGY